MRPRCPRSSAEGSAGLNCAPGQAATAPRVSASESVLFFGANERNFAPRTTSTRTHTLQQPVERDHRQKGSFAAFFRFLGQRRCKTRQQLP